MFVNQGLKNIGLTPKRKWVNLERKFIFVPEEKGLFWLNLKVKQDFLVLLKDIKQEIVLELIE